MTRTREILGELTHEWSLFLESLRAAEVGWKDEVASEFKKRFVATWESEMPAFLGRMEAVEHELNEADRISVQH